MEFTQEQEQKKHQQERVQLETVNSPFLIPSSANRKQLRSNMQRFASYTEHSVPEERLGYDPMIYPGLYSPSGFNVMDILVCKFSLMSIHPLLISASSSLAILNTPHLINVNTDRNSQTS